MKRYLYLLFVLVLLSCGDHATIDPEQPSSTADTLTIFFINDQHGQLNNFSKIKHLVDKEKETNEHVLLVCAGDMFSGNPIVDQYEEKGYPMIDIMNKTGFDVSVLGNHEFDYGPDHLKNRVLQAEFDWVCANVNMKDSGVPQPDAFTTIAVGDLKVTFLGLVETFGKPGAIIPATHPWRVTEMQFRRHTDVLNTHRNLKEEENSDVLIALTHLGTQNDLELAEIFPELDAVIGGHSHQKVNVVINDAPVVQAGSYLALLGRLDLIVDKARITSSEVSFIDLHEYSERDKDLSALIATYNNAPQFNEVIGVALSDHDRNELGCFYTAALKDYLQVDMSFQNGGGIRSNIDAGDITTLEIYNMDPFNNQSVIFTMTAQEVSDFFTETRAGLHVSGVTFQQSGQNLTLYLDGKAIPPEELVTIGINDYIPAVYDQYFPLEKAEIQGLTTAETIIEYLKTMNSTLDDEGCNQYFQY
ncbi:MAG: bifunctional UDP-sugar hydrolase/5'-nucleotidase [Marinoscillum sp.]|uniref:bifunctional metallophosphatase/5'-nucleotidase n=1 Tax=Marinoscillum sp. TaxID=2024838 RepID=UPI0032F58CA7